MNASDDVRYAWRLLKAGPLWLDGGSMFGVVPRAVWSRKAQPDEQGRIELAHNCLLLERQAGGRIERILIETGSGDKFDAKSRAMFGLGGRSIIDALEQAGIGCQDIGHILVSHLHFDHAGGLTRRGRDGQAVLTFPNAEVIVQRAEWESAVAGRSPMTRTYLRENLEPIGDRLRLVESPMPFGAGHIPERDALPPTPVSERVSRVLPGVEVFLVPGHTWGHQAVRFRDALGRTVVFCPDIIPTTQHVGSAYNMAYDVEPYMSTISRHWFLESAVGENWLLALVHEPRAPLQRVRPNGRGWYELVAEPLDAAAT